MTRGWGAVFLATILVVDTRSRPTITDGSQLASIAGIVVSDEDPSRPVRRAIVTVAGSALKASRSAVSDDKGLFSIAELPAGSYSLIASRATYLTSAHGALRPARLGTPLLVAPGAAVTGVRLRLWRGAVLAGTVRNERGHPVEGLPVSALPLKPSAARYLSLTNNGAATDEEGRFRIFGLEPGQYIISVAPSFAGALASSALRDEYVDAVLSDLLAGGRGNPLRKVTALQPALQTILYSPVYYPGTVRAEDAGPVSVSAGQTLEGLDMSLIQVPAANLAGTVLLPDGRPAAGAQVRLAADQSAGRSLPPGERPYGGTAGPTGSFVIPHVPAGAYELFATVTVDRPSRTRPGTRESTTLWATDSFVMGGSAVSGIVLQLAPGLTVGGRVMLASAGALPSGFAEVRIAAVPATAAIPASLKGSPTPPIARDGTFTLIDLRPRTAYRLIIDGLPVGWWPESAVVGGKEWLNGPVTLMADGTPGLTITVSDRPTTLSGTLTGEPLVGSVFIVAFPASRAMWGSERSTRAVQPDARGGYEFVNLPPGEYLVGAIGDVDPDEWRDPRFLEAVARVSIAVTLSRGETKRLDLKSR